MVLPVPKLDDRTFQDLVNETKKLIPRYCPQWTDHNVSDPGVTMIELFAYMVDVLLYRINRVPERNYLRWLEMLGLRLDPPRPAGTHMDFLLSGPQPEDVKIPVGTELATVRTESQNAIPFATDQDLNIYVPKLVTIRTTPHDKVGPDFNDYKRIMGQEGRPTVEMTDKNGKPTGQKIDAIGIFQDPPQPRDALYFGFEQDLSGHILRFTIEPDSLRGIGVNPNDPPYQWQYWDGKAWLKMEVEQDTTGGLNKPGEIVVHVPFGATFTPVGNDALQAFWLCLHSINPERGQKNYTWAPSIQSVEIEAIGGIVPVSQVEHVRSEPLGRSNGEAGQEFRLNYPPVLARRPSLHPGKTLRLVTDMDRTFVTVKNNDGTFTRAIDKDGAFEAYDAGETLIIMNEDGTFDEWQEVDDFGDSGPNDHHFTLDSLSGILRFGPTLRDVNGREKQYGAIPSADKLLVFTRYRTGGGAKGNVGANTITVLKSSIPYVDTVTNKRPATGGVDAESLEQTMMKGPQMLRVRSRAVTADDFEYLAMEASPQVARAKCIPPTPEQVKACNPVSRVLVVPNSNHVDELIPANELLLSKEVQVTVAQYLDSRRLVTAAVNIVPPVWRFVSIEVDVRKRRNVKADDLRKNIEQKLYKLINPVHGGPDGHGWPWERDLYQSEIIALVHNVEGVEHVEAVRLFYYEDANKLDDPSTRKPAQASITCPINGLLASGTHVVVIR